MYPPTYSGRKVPQQTQKWRFYPWAKGHLYGFSRLPYTAINFFFPCRKSAAASPKEFSCKIQKSAIHQLAEIPPPGKILTTPKSGSHQLSGLRTTPRPEATDWQKRHQLSKWAY
jgi:hypothetical protein